VPLSRHRAAVAASMTASARIPQFGLYRDIEVARLRDIRERSDGEAFFSYSDAVTAACARALRVHSSLNASFDEDNGSIVEHGEVNVGLALSAPAGLIVGVVRNADQLTLPQLALERHRLTTAAADGRLAGLDIFGATFVISNLGPAGVRMFQALLVPPLAAILAVGALRERPGEPPSVAMTVCLTLDHRVLDGMAGALFLQTVAADLERPDGLLKAAGRSL
jgi:pyruvate dehydrogenase E2 component (dihydrolipoamide acetyltransferase)